MEKEPFILVEKLSRAFGNRLALDEIDLSIPQGSFVGLAGPDGAGKTTLMRILAALLLPTSGQIRIAKIDLSKNPDKLHEEIGYMPQRFGLYEDLTVQQNLNLYADLQNVVGTPRQEAFDRLLAMMHLERFTNRLAGALSGGMKQKLGLACVLIKTPSLLILDEPTVGVDPISRRELVAMMRSLHAQGITIIWSTSYLEEAEDTDLTILLHEGKVLYQGSPQEFRKNHKTMDEAFIHLLQEKPNDHSILAKTTPHINGQKKIVIEAKELTKQFGSFTAVDRISFQVESGEIFGLLGPNGAGKSTTFKMLCGLLQPTAGQSFVNSVSLQSAPAKARSHIGYMAQKFSLYGNLSVKQNLEFFSGAYNLLGKERDQMIAHMIDIFYLEPFLDQSAQDLPIGFKQRLSLACSVMHRPEVLFLDEPTSGVDPITRREFWNHICGLAKLGCTILVTTHSMSEAESCDRIALIYQSKLIHMGTPSELKALANTSSLEEAFIHLIEEYDAVHTP